MITQTSPYELTPASDADYNFIYGVARATMHDYVDRLWGWDEAFQSSRFHGAFCAEEWQLVMVDNRRAGCVNIQYSDSEIFLANIYLLPQFQRRGIGSSIIRRLQQLGEATDRPVRLNVLTTNSSAYKLYLRLGFHVVESTPEKRLMST
jgi:ribosomal protein S18 acetylase RimI-like enzyme